MLFTSETKEMLPCAIHDFPGVQILFACTPESLDPSELCGQAQPQQVSSASSCIGEVLYESRLDLAEISSSFICSFALFISGHHLLIASRYII